MESKIRLTKLYRMKILPKGILWKNVSIEKIMRALASIILFFGLLEPFIFPVPAQATNAHAYLRLDRQISNLATGASVCFNPKTNETTVRKLQISFPGSGNGTQGAAAFGVNQVDTNWTFDTTATNIPVGTTAFPGTAGTDTVNSNTVYFVVTADQSLNTGTTYCLHFTSTNTLTTPTSANNNLTGTIALMTNAGATISGETVNYATADISNDQITVTAQVAAAFSMTLSSTTAQIATGSALPISGNPSVATAITLTISTNAANGWIAWAKNANANSTLTSATTGDTSISSGAFTAGSGNIHNLNGAAGYGMFIVPGTGAPTAATEYSTDQPSVGSLDSTQFEKIVSAAAPASGNTATLNFAAEASATTKPATDYTDTVTVTAAGQF